jgi:hypothetical protein
LLSSWLLLAGEEYTHTEKERDGLNGKNDGMKITRDHDGFEMHLGNVIVRVGLFRVILNALNCGRRISGADKKVQEK